MAEDRTVAGSPLRSSDGALGVQVSCDGKALPDAARLVSVQVRRAVGTVASARLTFADGDMATGTWPLADADTFAPGAAVRIEAGYDGRMQALFEGIVAALSVRISGDNDCRLVVECRDVDGQLTAPAPAIAAEPVLKLTCGEDLVGFRADLDARRQRPSAQAGASDPKTQAQQLRAGLARISGRMSFPGSALAVPGKLIALAGVGARFSGDVFVGAVEHDIENGNWLTHAEFGLADERLVEDAGVPAPPAAGAVPANDLEAAKDANAWMTRSGHKLAFDDDDQVATLTTRGGNTVVLSDKDKAVLLRDQNGNTVRLDGAGIVLDSTRDVVIRAAANIELSAGGEARIAAAADAGVKGLNVTCEAQVALTAKGSASAELSAAGQTTVKGAMVMIN